MRIKWVLLYVSPSRILFADNRRHTLQGELPAVATHDLHKGVGEHLQKEKENELPKEILDEYKHLSREVRYQVIS